jgi:hypothetical protein
MYKTVFWGLMIFGQFPFLLPACMDGETLDPCLTLSTWDCLTDTALGCTSYSAYLLSDSATCQNPSQQAFCYREPVNCRHSESRCAIDPDDGCWCGLGCIPNGWTWADKTEHASCKDFSQEDYKGLPLCKPYTCQERVTQSDCTAGGNCEWFGGSVPQAENECVRAFGACVPLQVRSTGYAGMPVIRNDGVCFIWNSTYVPPNMISCGLLTLSEEEQEACKPCIALVKQSQNEQWPACSAVDDDGCGALSPSECNSSRSDEGYRCESFYGMSISPEGACIEPLRHIACQRDRTECPKKDASNGTACAVAPDGICWCGLIGCLPSDWTEADGSQDGPCSQAIQAGVTGLPSCVTFACSAYNDASNCEADSACGIWIATSLLEIDRTCTHPNGECLPFFAGYVESDFPSTFSLLDPQGRCNRGFRDIGFRDGEGVIPGWTRCDPPSRDLTDTEKATCEACIDAIQSYNESEWPACTDGDTENTD